MVRRSLAVIGIAFAALVLLAPAASAQYVDPGGISVDDPNPDVGDSIVVTGSGCEPDATVTVTLTQGDQSVVVGQFTADADGNYTGSVTIPSSFSAGTATLSDSCGNSLTLTIGAVAAAALPRTGSNTGTLWRVAVALMAAGGILVLTTRKRTAKVQVEA